MSTEFNSPSPGHPPGEQFKNSWEGVMNLKGRQLRAVLMGTFLVLAFSVAFFLPEIVSIYWHARFGDSTTFHGWKVPVPRGWWAFIREDLLIIQKPTRFYQAADAPTISVEIFSPDKSVDPEDVKQASTRAILKQGYVLQGDRPIQIGTDQGYCLDFNIANDHKNVRSSCYLSASHLSLELFGRPSEVQAFCSMVAQVRREVAPH